MSNGVDGVTKKLGKIIEKQCLGKDGNCLTLLDANATKCYKCGSKKLNEIREEDPQATDFLKGCYITPSPVGAMGIGPVPPEGIFPTGGAAESS